jgi:O-antigen/teichoic acid export membrane protein
MADLDSLKEMLYGTGITFFFGVVAYFLMFLFRLLAARYYGPADFGTFSLVETILGIALLVAGFGFFRGITRYMPLYKHRSEKLLSGYLFFTYIASITSAIICSAILFFVAPLLTQFFSLGTEFTLFIRITSIIIPFKVVSRIVRKTLLSEKKIMWNQLSVNLVEPGILLLGILVFIIMKAPLIYMIYLLAIQAIVAIPFDLFLHVTTLKIRIEPKKEYRIKEWVWFSLPLLLTGVFAYIIRWTDKSCI